jgi:cystathionine beta-synthase
MGLALVAIIKGYKLICVMSDKQSKEKMDILRAVGAKVVVCPTDVEPTDLVPIILFLEDWPKKHLIHGM